MQTAERIPPELANHSQYRNVRKLGEGGMGAIYIADQPLLQRQVVLKVISPQLASEPGAVERFIREMMASTRLNHENIATAYTAEQLGELLILVMEYVPGRNLDQVVKQQGPLDHRLAIDYIRQAALGLAHAHDKGMVHRDIKPSNLMVGPEGRVKILDFGLVKGDAASPLKSGQQGVTGLTGSNTIMGTPDFMSPEQIQDAGTAKAAADIYSLGGTFFYLLTGEPPFTDPEDKLLNIYLAHLSTPPRRVDGLRPDLPREIADLIQSMLSKTPAQRPASARAVADALAPNSVAVAAPARTGSMVKTGAGWLEYDVPATAPVKPASMPALPKGDTKPEMKLSTVNEPKPPALDPWMLENLAAPPGKPASRPSIVVPRAPKPPAKWLKPVLISLGLLALAGAGVGGFLLFGERQATHNEEYLREIRAQMKPLLAADKDPADARRKWNDFLANHATLAASEKLADIRTELEGFEKAEADRQAKWKGLFEKLRIDSKSLDDADFLAAEAKIKSVARTKTETDALKGLEDNRLTQMQQEYAIWETKLKPMRERGEELVAESRSRTEDLSQLQRTSDRISQFQGDFQEAVKDLQKRQISHWNEVERLRQTLRDRSDAIETAMRDVRGLDKLSAALKANPTAAGWTGALTAFLDENRSSDYAVGFRKVIGERPQWEAPIEWAALKDDLFKTDPWNWLDESREERLYRMEAFFKKYGNVLKGTNILPARDLLLTVQSVASRPQLPQHREKLAKVFDNPGLTGLYQFDYIPAPTEKNVTAGVYYISEDQRISLQKGKLRPNGVTVLRPLVSEGKASPNDRNFKASGIKGDEAVPAKHTALCARLAKEIGRSTETDWLAEVFAVADSLVADKEVDPALRAVLLRRTLSLATLGCPECGAAVQAKIADLEKAGGKDDLNWADPTDATARKVRDDLRAYFRNKPAFADIRDEVKKERDTMLANLRKPMPAVVGYLVKPAGAEWQCKLADALRTSGDLVGIALENGSIAWRKVGTLSLGQPKLLNGSYTNGMLVFLKKD